MSFTTSQERRFRYVTFRGINSLSLSVSIVTTSLSPSNQLVTTYSNHLVTPQEVSDSGKHCVLEDANIYTVDQLQKFGVHPIVILVKCKSSHEIR